MVVTHDHFQAALQRVPPSLTRGLQLVSERGLPFLHQLDAHVPVISCMLFRSAPGSVRKGAASASTLYQDSGGMQ